MATKFKARVVGKGFRQVEGLDYEETFSPTVRFESVRALVALVAGIGSHLDQMNVATAFLYAELEEETFVEIPEGVAPMRKGDMVWRLRKYLYGLKQSPRMWNQTIDSCSRSWDSCGLLVSMAFMSGGRGRVESSWHCMSTTCCQCGMIRRAC